MRKDNNNEVYTRFFEYNLGLICVADFHGKFKLLNQNWEKFLGYSLKELYSKPFIEFVHQDDQKQTIKEYQRIIKQRGKIVSFENRYRTHDGDYKNLLWNAKSDPEKEMIYATCCDVSKLKKQHDEFKIKNLRISKELQQSKDNMSALFNNNIDGIIMMNHQGILSEVNSSITRIFGYQTNELIGSYITLLIPSLFENEYGNIERYLKTKKSKMSHIHVEVSGSHKNGKNIPLDLTISRMKSQEKNSMFLVVLRDLTERKKTEHQLFETSRLQQAILDSANFTIISTDINGIIKTFNAGAERMLQYKAENIIDKVTPEVIHDAKEIIERSKILSEELNQSIEPGFEVFVAKAKLGFPDENEWTYIKKDGSTFPVLLSVTALHDQQGKINGFLGIGRDITENKKAELIKSEFVSTVSHELRTPLTSIRGSLALIEAGITGELPPKAKDMISIANNNCKRLIRLINDILDVSKIKSGHMKFNFSIHNITDIIKQSIKDNEHYAQEHQVALKLIDHRIQSMLLIDPDKIIQVVTNLLSNAIKFSPKNSRIRIEILDCKDHIRIEVTDKGKGIPTEFKHRVFEKFSQADSSDTKKVGGTGLGLNISQEIIKKHEGTIGFSCDNKKGTTFYFTLNKLFDTGK